jgi:deoxycytidylate deaminase
MNTQLKSVPSQPASTSEAGLKSTMELFKSRESQEIVIAFAGPIGCGIGSVNTKAAEVLKELGYQVKKVKLSKFLQDCLNDKLVETLPKRETDSDKFSRYRNLQHAGGKLRDRFKSMALLAEFAAKEIRVYRDANSNDVVNNDISQLGKSEPQRTAYLIDQVKRPEEVELLRVLYRHLFYLVGVTKSYTQRHKTLADEGISSEEITELMEIDRNETGEDSGQRLGKTLHLADFFIRNDDSLDQRESIRRFVRLIHGDKTLTPNRLETGMYAAYAAGLRSACLSRQVGAAITNLSGEILATGCNDVSTAGGGLYREDDESRSDKRCVHLQDAKCFNDLEKHKLKQSIGEVLKQHLDALNLEHEISSSLLTEFQNSIYDKTRLGSLIEFSRSVHAEMDAIVSLARRGGPGLLEATLYTTTFPCHSCARHIVAAGISQVFYIEPYEKSLAQELHKDAIAFEDLRPISTISNINAKQEKLVQFLHFEGVSPRLFAVVFRAEDRKERKTGKYVPIAAVNPPKVLPEYLDKYQEFETVAVSNFDTKLNELVSSPY